MGAAKMSMVQARKAKRFMRRWLPRACEGAMKKTRFFRRTDGQ
jgi:hypothetical protein